MYSRDIRSYLCVNTLSTFARTLPQAILTPLLVTKGLSYDGVIVTQIVYMIILGLAEYPSGVLADRVSKKQVYLASIGVTGAAYSLVWLSNGLAAMACAWAIYALGSALASSTLDVHFAARLRRNDRAFRAFFSMDRTVVVGATIGGALASSVLYPHLGSAIYGVSIAVFVVALIGGWVSLPLARQAEDGPDGSTTKKAASPERPEPLKATIRSDPRVARIVALGTLTQIGMTPFFQLWQFVALDARVSPSLFGVLFIVSQLLNVVANVIFRRSRPSFVRSLVLLGFVAGVGVAGLVSGGSLSLILLALLPLPLFLYSNQIEFSLQSIAPRESIASITSFLGSTSTVASLLVLGGLFFGLRFCTADVLLWFFVIAFACTSTVLTVTSKRQTPRKVSDGGRDG